MAQPETQNIENTDIALMKGYMRREQALEFARKYHHLADKWLTKENQRISITGVSAVNMYDALNENWWPDTAPWIANGDKTTLPTPVKGDHAVMAYYQQEQMVEGMWKRPPLTGGYLPARMLCDLIAEHNIDVTPTPEEHLQWLKMGHAHDEIDELLIKGVSEEAAKAMLPDFDYLLCNVTVRDNADNYKFKIYDIVAAPQEPGTWTIYVELLETKRRNNNGIWEKVEPRLAERRYLPLAGSQKLYY